MSETPDVNRSSNPEGPAGGTPDEPRYGVRREDVPPGSYPPPVNPQQPMPEQSASEPRQGNYNAMNGWDSNPQPGWGQPASGYDQNGWPVNNSWQQQQQPMRRPGLMIAGCVLAWVLSALGLLSSFGLLMVSNLSPQQLERVLVEEMPAELIDEFHRSVDSMGGFDALSGLMRGLGIGLLVFCALLSVAAIFIITGSNAWRIVGVILAAAAGVLALFGFTENPLVAILWLAATVLMVVGWTTPATNTWIRHQTQLKRSRR